MPQSSAPSSPGRTARRVLRPILAAGVAVLALWAALALAIDGPWPPAGAAFALASAGLLPGRRLRRPRRLLWCLLFVAVLVWWLGLAARNDRDWQPDVALLPDARIEGERIVFSSVRDFDWSSAEEGTERWTDRSFPLGDVVGVDLVTSDWGAPAIVHTLLSFQLADGRRLAVSIETRKERGESYSAISGLFRQYELYYVVAEERDVIGVRAVHRGERLRLYPLAVEPETARELLISYARRMEELQARAVWYNALTSSCTTSIRRHALELGLARPWDWRLLANGRVDRMLFENGRIASSLPFDALRERSDVTAAAVAAFEGAEAEFSARLRRDLPR
jgi:hypothetical protein